MRVRPDASINALRTPRVASPGVDSKMNTHKIAHKLSGGFLFLLSMMLFIIIGTGCGDQFESYRTASDVPSDLKQVQLSLPNSITALQYTSEEALLFFSQCDGIELETVPPAEVRKYQ